MPRMIDIPQIHSPLYPLSVDAYHALGRLGLIDEDVELLDGFLYKKMSKSPLHETLVEIFKNLLGQAISGDVFITKERPLTLATSEPEPDLAVVRGSFLDYREQHPGTAELIIEVSINTQARDKEKAAIYAAADVSEYWIVEPEARSVTVFTIPSATGYRNTHTVVSPEEIVCGVIPNLRIPVAQVFG